MKQWRVLHVGPDASDLGGMETVLRTYANAEWEHLEVEVVPSTTTRGPRARARTFATALRAIRRGRCDIVHVHLSQRGSFVREGALALLARRGTRRVATVHGSSFTTSARHPLWGRVYAFVLKRLDAVGVLNDAALSSASRLAPGTPCAVLPNPGPVTARPEAVPRRKPPVFFFAGKLGTRKGLDTLLTAWQAVERARPGAARLELAGPLDLPAHISPADIEAHYVGALGPREVVSRLSTATAAVLPSTGEGQPMFLIEALATGTPMIVTDVGGMPGLANGCGVVVPVGDALALAEAIIHAIDSPAQIEEWSRAAQQAYERTFSPASHEHGLLALYARATAG